MMTWIAAHSWIIPLVLTIALSAYCAYEIWLAAREDANGNPLAIILGPWADMLGVAVWIILALIIWLGYFLVIVLFK